MTGSLQNSQVAKIIGITQRQVIAWTEKGLVTPAIEASGAGTKREYNYKNLLEFGLTKKLLLLGLGIQTVKNIVTTLRANGSMHSWVEDFEFHHNKIQSERREYWTRSIGDLKKSNPDMSDELAQKLGEFWEGFINYPHGSEGFLIVTLGEKEKLHIAISPFSVEFSCDTLKRQDSLGGGAAIIVDLGAIKAEIDKRI